MRFWPFGGNQARRNVRRDAADKLAELDVDAKKERIADRKAARDLIMQGVQTNNPLALQAASILTGRKGAMPVSAPNSPMDDVMKVLLARALEPPEDPLERMYKLREMAIEQKRMMRELDDDEDEPQRGSQLAEIAKAFAPVVMSIVAPQQMQAAMQAQAAQAAQAQQAAAQPHTTITELPAPVAQEQLQAPQAAPAPAGGEPPMPMQILMRNVVLGNLEKMPPEQFADWLAGQKADEARGIVGLLQQTEPEHLPARLTELAAQSSDVWRPVFQWLIDHPEQSSAIHAALCGDEDDEDDEDDAVGM